MADSPTKAHLRRWGALYILIALFIGSWTGQFLNQIAEVSNQANDLGTKFAWSQFWPSFFSSTFENWQSEFLQLAVQAVLLSSFLHVKTFQAENSADKDDIQRILDELQRHRQLSPEQSGGNAT